MENKNMGNLNISNMTSMNENMMKMTPDMTKPLPMSDTNQMSMREMETKMREYMSYQAAYPEVYYMLQPYIIMVCDQMDTYGITMPTQDMIEQLSDGICDDVSRMHPEMAEYMDNYTKNDPSNDPPNDPPYAEAINYGRYGRDRDFGFGMFGRRRRRGNIRDLIEILLLSEFFRRRRRRY